ncbi:zf-TFIIB domain-containing protein [Priestia koreensis]
MSRQSYLLKIRQCAQCYGVWFST